MDDEVFDFDFFVVECFCFVDDEFVVVGDVDGDVLGVFVFVVFWVDSDVDCDVVDDVGLDGFYVCDFGFVGMLFGVDFDVCDVYELNCFGCVDDEFVVDFDGCVDWYGYFG